MQKFILLHLQSNNSTVAVNIDTIHIVIKDSPDSDDDDNTSRKGVKKKQGPYTCVYFGNAERIRRIFVNESVERVYNMINDATSNHAPIALSMLNDENANKD